MTLERNARTSEPHEHIDEELDDHDRGLSFDLATLLDRRQVLRLFGGAGLVAGLFVAAGCGGAGAARSQAATTASAGRTSSGASCDPIPEETAGPFPGDGSNGPDILSQSGVVRGDIRSSFGSASGVADGVPLMIRLTILDRANGCAPLVGAAVYVWHCNRDGEYSLYGEGVTDQNYLRGVQQTSSDGQVSFTSIYPACYSGRWPHIHFEVYPSLGTAASATKRLATSQIALPKAACAMVYATEGYSQSLANLGEVSLATDMVFGDDGGVHELGTVTGSIDKGMVVELIVPVAT